MSAPSPKSHGLPSSYVLIYQDYSNVLSLFRESDECLLDLRLFRLRIAYEKVLLSVRRLGYVPSAGEEETCDGTGER